MGSPNGLQQSQGSRGGNMLRPPMAPPPINPQVSKLNPLMGALLAETLQPPKPNPATVMPSPPTQQPIPFRPMTTTNPIKLEPGTNPETINKAVPTNYTSPETQQELQRRKIGMF